MKITATSAFTLISCVLLIIIMELKIIDKYFSKRTNRTNRTI